MKTPLIDFNDEGKLIPVKMMTLVNNKHAFHKLGYMGRPTSNNTEFIVVHHEKENYYVGHFWEGLGFMNVHFFKEDCQELTPDETQYIANHEIKIVSIFKKDENFPLDFSPFA